MARRTIGGHALSRLARALGIPEIDRELKPDDRLNALASELLRKFERAIKIVGVGQRQGRHLVGARELGELGDRQGAFEERIGRVNVQMHETDVVDRHRALPEARTREARTSKLKSASSMPRPKHSGPFRQFRRTGPHVIWPARNDVASESHRGDRPDPDHGQKAAKSGNFHNVFHKNASHGTSLFDPIMFYLCSAKDVNPGPKNTRST